MLTLIDADSLAYANAFAVEKKDDDGKVRVSENGQIFLRKKLRDSIKTILDETGASDYKLFLTGKGNFRETDDNLYKANREGMRRPILLQYARQYLVDQYDAIVVEDMEADDRVCMEQTSCLWYGVDSVIAHIDKDIDQQEGLHYRWSLRGKPSVSYTVTEEEGLRNLYVQALVGDKVDNIMYYFGSDSNTWKKDYGLGQKTAEKYLAVHHTAAEMYTAVRSQYLHSPKFIKKSTEGQCTEEDLLDNMFLLYMIRHEEDFYQPPVQMESYNA